MHRASYLGGQDFRQCQTLIQRIGTVPTHSFPPASASHHRHHELAAKNVQRGLAAQVQELSATFRKKQRVYMESACIPTLQYDMNRNRNMNMHRDSAYRVPIGAGYDDRWLVVAGCGRGQSRSVVVVGRGACSENTGSPLDETRNPRNEN